MTKDTKLVKSEFAASRVKSVFDKHCMNRAINQKSDELQVKLDKLKKFKSYLEQDSEPKFKDRAQVFDEEGKPVMEKLTKQRRQFFTKEVEKLESEVPKIESEKNMLQPVRIRFNEDVSHGLAAVCEHITHDILEHAMKIGKLASAKTLKPEYMYGDGVEQLATYPLFRTLPSWQNRPEAKKKTLKKKDGETAEQTEKAAEKATKKTTVEDEQKTKSEFFHYVEAVCKNLVRPVKLDENGEKVTTVAEDKDGKQTYKVVHMETEYSSLRVPKEIKEHINNILVEFLERITPMVHNHIKDMKVRTLAISHVMSVIKNIMCDGCPFEDTLKLVDREGLDPKAEEDRKEKHKRFTMAKKALESESEAEVLEGKKTGKMLPLTAERKAELQAIVDEGAPKKTETKAMVKMYERSVEPVCPAFDELSAFVKKRIEDVRESEKLSGEAKAAKKEAESKPTTA